MYDVLIANAIEAPSIESGLGASLMFVVDAGYVFVPTYPAVIIDKQRATQDVSSVRVPTFDVDGTGTTATVTGSRVGQVTGRRYGS